MRRAADRGHHILYVETGPFLGRSVLGLLWGPDRLLRLRELISGREAATRVIVLRAPNLLPWGHKYQLSSAVNGRLTAAVVRHVARRLPTPSVLWIYDPCAARAVGACGEAFAVYDCVDDYSALTFYDRHERSLVERSDRLAASSAQVVFTTTTTLFERHRHVNRETHLVRNVGDFRHFAPAADPALAADELRGLQGPVIGFTGRFMTGKIDFELLEAMARAHPEWSLVLVGPADRAATKNLADLTNAAANVRWLGPKPYEDVPRYVAAFDVGLCPYVWNDWMRSGFPLKLYEYLAAGKPVVASGNPDLAGMEPDVVLARGPGEFVGAVEAALLLRSDEDRQRRIAIASRNTWETRTERLLALVSAQFGAAAGDAGVPC